MSDATAAESPTTGSEVVLSPDQAFALDRIIAAIVEAGVTGARKVVSLVGPAGTGKTMLVRRIQALITSGEVNKRVAALREERLAPDREALLTRERTLLEKIDAARVAAAAKVSNPIEDYLLVAPFMPKKTRGRYEKLAQRAFDTSGATTPNEKAFAKQKLYEAVAAARVDVTLSRFVVERLDKALAHAQKVEALASGNTSPEALRRANESVFAELEAIRRRLNATQAVQAWRCQFVAPTGKVAARLTEIVGVRATTIHRALYAYVDDDGEDARGRARLKFSDPHAPCGGLTVLICDEAEMVSGEVYSDLTSSMPKPAVLLLVGDREQLPPVEDFRTAQKFKRPDLSNPTAELTTVHRQALGNPILRIATAVRNGRAFHSAWSPGDAPIVRFTTGRRADYNKTLTDVVRWIVDKRERNIDATVVVYTNALRRSLNRVIRDHLGLSGPLAPNDRVLIRANNYTHEMMNGEVFDVATVEPVSSSGHRGLAVTMKGREHDDPVFVDASMIGEGQREWKERMEATTLADARWFEMEDARGPEWGASLAGRMRARRNWIHLDYGQALTCHACIGSEFDEIGVVWDNACWGLQRRDAVQAQQWVYTALTRAKQRLALWYIETPDDIAQEVQMKRDAAFKPYLKWPGGKARLADAVIAQLLPSGQGVNAGAIPDLYVEPFIGAGAVFLRMHERGLVRSAYLADVNARLIATHTAVRDDVEGVISALKALPWSPEACRAAFEERRFEFNNTPPAPTAMFAAQMVWLNKTSFNGLYRENSKGEFNAPVGDCKNPSAGSPDTFRSAGRALQRAKLVVEDFRTVLRAVELLPEDVSVRVYCDPPYAPASETASFTGYVAGGFGEEDQIALANVLWRLSERKRTRVVASNADVPFIRDRYGALGFTLVEVARPGTISSDPTQRGPVGELLLVRGGG